MHNCTASPSLPLSRAPKTKVWIAPVVQIVRASDAQATTLNNTIDGYIPTGNGSTPTFGS